MRKSDKEISERKKRLVEQEMLSLQADLRKKSEISQKAANASDAKEREIATQKAAAEAEADRKAKEDARLEATRKYLHESSVLEAAAESESNPEATRVIILVSAPHEGYKSGLSG